MPLLKQYLLMRQVIENAPDPGEAARRWSKAQKKALDEFTESYGPDNGKLKDVIQRFQFTEKGLHAIRDDLDGVADVSAQPVDLRAMKRLTVAATLVDAGKASDMLEALGKLEDVDLDFDPAVLAKALKLQK
jgi:hypothetical protein